MTDPTDFTPQSWDDNPPFQLDENRFDYYITEEPTIPCPTCDGNGGALYSGPCTDCLGTGEIPAQ
jgi:DnaJ-class molecular chaperone